eukprot:9189619-Alexandrium_andersonii.AAC.1
MPRARVHASGVPGREAAQRLARDWLVGAGHRNDAVAAAAATGGVCLHRQLSDGRHQVSGARRRRARQ